MEAAGALARLVVATVLLTSATAKLRSPAAFRPVLRGLGLGHTREWWLAVCGLELLTAVGVLVPVSTVVPAALVAFVGTLFAGAGLRALLSGRSIQCACFGTAHSWRLGRPQLVLLPFWLLFAFVVTWWRPAGGEQSAALATVVLVAPLTLSVVRLLRATYRARADRLAVAE